MEDPMDNELLNRLIAPIPGGHPCGEDMSYATEFDEIREARRQDDTSLAQGDWATEPKVAQWPLVAQQCEALLTDRSKDLQVACWYAEAMAHLHGFEGLHFGLQVLEVLVTDFWEFCYPSFDPDDLEERAGKIEWLNRQMSTTVRNLPLTAKASGAYSWLKWNESRMVDNLGLKNPEAKARAVAEGKLSADAFDKAAATSGLSFYQNLGAQTHGVRAILQRIEKHVDEKFGVDAPSLKDFRDAVADCIDVVDKLTARLGGRPEMAAGQTAATAGKVPVEATATPLAASQVQATAIGQIRSRAEAVSALRNAAQFFKLNEPHSPVGHLADRAAKWAEMPLEQWLASVIKDEGTLGQLRELLDMSSAP
jgi:type VI secretion system protein ImpA